MSRVPYSAFRRSLAKSLDRVSDGRGPLYITRRHAPAVVVMSEADYEGMIETLHLLCSPANATRLMVSIDAADFGKAS